MSLKEKASEDGGGVLDGEEQEGGMERKRLHKYSYMCIVHEERENDVMYARLPCSHLRLSKNVQKKHKKTT